MRDVVSSGSSWSILVCMVVVDCTNEDQVRKVAMVVLNLR